MKFSLFVIAAALASAEAISKPSLSISVTDGSFDSIDGLDPTLEWKDSTSAGDVDIEYGIEAAVRPTTDIASLPRKVFGTLKTETAGWGLSAGATRDMASGDTDINVDATNADADLSAQLVATIDGGVSSVSASKGLDVGDAKVTISPTYDLGSEEANVVLGYDNGDTNVELTASADSQEVVIKHSMGDTDIQLTASKDSQEVVVEHTVDDTNLKLTASADNQEVTISRKMGDDTITPTINNSGDISVAWERDLGDDNSVSFILKPKDSLDVEWKDDNWTATVNCGLDGTNIDGVSISTKREVNF
jgi:hypothetical protein